MNETGAPHPADILQYAIDALDDIREATLPPEKWERFGGCLVLMNEALDHHDLAAVNRYRQQIEALENLLGAKADLATDVRQSVPLREQADRLRDRLRREKGDGSGPDDGRGR
ncbi:CATRA system-associated protein [Micromonospora schwarzwaldensis]|uniref:CATRA system-associated protein n=1 Tax=Micromonospora sp. DSM 45708 TaxID=3111767 RepID=UPI0031D184B3